MQSRSIIWQCYKLKKYTYIPYFSGENFLLYFKIHLQHFGSLSTLYKCPSNTKQVLSLQHYTRLENAKSALKVTQETIEAKNLPIYIKFIFLPKKTKISHLAISTGNDAFGEFARHLGTNNKKKSTLGLRLSYPTLRTFPKMCLFEKFGLPLSFTNSFSFLQKKSSFWA